MLGRTFSSLYIGGGTSTVNWPGRLSILEHLQARLGPGGEICIELHPGSMEPEGLSALPAA